MSEKYKNKYRIASARLQNWDYGWAGAYFITICTKNRTHYFGNIEEGQSKMSSIGIMADILWHEIKNHAKNIELGEFVVMPNHIHGILILNEENNKNGDNVETRHALSLPPPTQSPSPPTPPPPSQPQKTIGQKRFQNQGKNTVSSIIGGYKSAVTKHARRLGFDFAWQARFWDHIIRNEKEYHRIAQYIINNPQKWEDDKLNGGPGNIVMEPAVKYGEEIWMI